jgi:serine protease AprX
MVERRRPLCCVPLALAIALATHGAATAAAPGPWAAKVAPGLAAMLETHDEVTVWVEFADKGEAGPADLAARLAAAQASLTPRARARRERARVAPRVDERDLPVDARYLDDLRARGFQPFAVSRWLNRAALRVPGARIGAAAALPFVSRITPVARVVRSPEPTPALPGRVARGEAPARAQLAYGLTAAQLAQMNLPALHDSGYVGTGIIVCILDNGFTGHSTHEALASQIIPPGYQRDFVDGDLDPSNAPGNFPHGAWAMGCIAGAKPGTYVGAAFGATFALGRTENDAREFRDEMLYWGMGAEWADSLGADIISSSLGYNTFDTDPDYTYADMNGHTTDITRYAEIAASKGILVVNAVGNEGNKPWIYLVAPADASGDSLIAVGAVDEFGRHGAFSSFGPSADGRIKPDLVARGVQVPLVAPENGNQSYETEDGTSFSTPLVAGLAACLMQARPAWRPVDVVRALRETASQASRPDNSLGYGIPDGARALCWQVGVGVPNPNTARVLGPNPMRAGDPPVTVRFAAGGVLEGSNPAHIRVHDLQGRRVSDLWSGSLARGQCVDVSWDGRDLDHRLAHSGCYFVSLTVGGEVTTARVVWLR